MLPAKFVFPKVTRTQIQFRECKLRSWNNEFPTALEPPKIESRSRKRFDVLMNRLLFFELLVFTVAQGRAKLHLDERKKIRHASDSARHRGKEIGSCWMERGCKIAIARGIQRILLQLKCGGTGLIGRRGTMLPSIHTTYRVVPRFRVSSNGMWVTSNDFRRDRERGNGFQMEI